MNKPSFSEALRIAKQVKLNLAGAAEGKVVSMTAQDKARAYRVAMRKQGKTVTDLKNEQKFRNNLLKDIGF